MANLLLRFSGITFKSSFSKRCFAGVFYLLSMLILSSSFPRSLTAKEVITWMLVEWPPYVIHQGKFKNQGTVDETVRFLTKQLPNYQHEVIYSSAKRLFSDIAEQSNICSATWLKNPEREKSAIFSIPYSPAPAVALVTTQAKAGKFKEFLYEDKSISIKDLLQNHHELKLGIINKRSYTRALDSIIRHHLDNENVFVRTAEDLGGGLLKMLAFQWIDYTIEYPHVVTYSAQEKGLDMTPVFIPIHEIGEKTLYGHVICSNSNFGKKVIDDVNVVLRSNMSDVLTIVEKWFSPDIKKMLQDNGAYEYVHNQ